jgi:HTH-type transcriptional regulator / antitoxin HigA
MRFERMSLVGETKHMTQEPLSPAMALQIELTKRGWNQTEFADIIGRPGRLVSEILSSKRSITPETAKEFAAALNTTPQYWIELEASYQLSKLAPVSVDVGRKARLRERFPVREMIKRNWIRNSDKHDELESFVLKFFNISNLDDQVVFDHAARRNYSNALTSSQEAWLFRVHQLASALNVPKYSETRLREGLSRLELLMTEPEEIRHVPTILSECGVRFIVVEPIPGSRIDGVCFWIDKNRSPIIGLSLKGGDQIDRFWFNLRHEIEHVLRGDGRDAAIIDTFEDAPLVESEAEMAANIAAADFCVPVAKMKDFYARHHPIYTEKSLIGFSKIVRRHPGIVAGQLQKRLDRWDLFKKYQVKVRHILTQTALTDGYGKSVPIGEQ